MDVGNLAGEKEELNNQLKDMQQRERRSVCPGAEKAKLFNAVRITNGLFSLPGDVRAELQRAREEGKQMAAVKASFEKQLQSEKTLKIQVRL